MTRLALMVWLNLIAAVAAAQPAADAGTEEAPPGESDSAQATDEVGADTVPLDALDAPDAPPLTAAGCPADSLQVLVDDGPKDLLPAAEQACPLPRGLLGTSAERRLWGTEAASATELSQALDSVARELAARYPGWGQDLARAMRTSSTRDAKTRDIEFVSVSVPDEIVDSDVAQCECTFVTARPFSSERACYRMQGSAPPGPCRVTVREFRDWSELAPAFYLFRLAERGLKQLDRPARSAAHDALVVAGKRWDNLRKNGYIQYPWELIGSRIGRRYRDFQACFAKDASCEGHEGLSPERVRTIFLHPSLGLAFPGFGTLEDSSPSSKALPSLNVEVAGFVAYGERFKHYAGLSVAGAFVDFDFGGPYLGPFLHLTRYVHVGHLWCVAGNRRKDAVIAITFDVASWVGRWMDKGFQTFTSE